MTSTLKPFRILGTGLLLLAVASFAPSLRAQTPPPPAPAPAPEHKGGSERMLEHMKKDLDLTDDQCAKIKDIFKSEDDAKKAIKDNSSLTEEEKMTQMKALREANRPKIEAVLTPAQLEKFKAMHHHGAPGAGAPPAQ